MTSFLLGLLTGLCLCPWLVFAVAGSRRNQRIHLPRPGARQPPVFVRRQAPL